MPTLPRGLLRRRGAGPGARLAGLATRRRGAVLTAPALSAAAARQRQLSETLARQTAEAEQQIAAAKQRALSDMHGIATEVARSVTEKVMGSAADPGNLATAVDRALAERVS